MNLCREPNKDGSLLCIIRENHIGEHSWEIRDEGSVLEDPLMLFIMDTTADGSGPKLQCLVDRSKVIGWEMAANSANEGKITIVFDNPEAIDVRPIHM